MKLLLALFITYIPLSVTPRKQSPKATAVMGYYGNYSTINEVIQSFYYSLSSEPGNPPDWKLFHNLFMKGARFIQVNNNKYRSMSIDTFETSFKKKIDDRYLDSFHEHEISQKINRIRNVAQVFSKYRSSFVTKDDRGKGKGINSFQLMKSHGRWWIASVIWDQKGSKTLIAPHYIPALNKQP